MNDFKMCLIVFIIAFAARFGIYHFSKKKKKSKGIMMEMQYLINRFRLEKKKIDNYKIALIISIIDALIISISLFLIIKITDEMILQLLLAFILVFGLIILSNEILGRFLKKKGYDQK